MPLGQASMNPVGVTYFSLINPADMVACLEALLAIDYHGSVLARKDQHGAVEWGMIIDNAVQTNIQTNLGDVLIWDGVALSVMRIEQFQDRYTVQ